MSRNSFDLVEKQVAYLRHLNFLTCRSAFASSRNLQSLDASRPAGRCSLHLGSPVTEGVPHEGRRLARAVSGLRRMSVLPAWGAYFGRCSVCSLPPWRGGWRQVASAACDGSVAVMSMRCGDSRKMTSTRRVWSSSQPPEAATGIASP